MAKVRVRTSTKLGNGSRMVVNQSVGEYVATGIVAGFFKWCAKSFVGIFKLIFYIFVFYIKYLFLLPCYSVYWLIMFAYSKIKKTETTPPFNFNFSLKTFKFLK